MAQMRGFAFEPPCTHDLTPGAAHGASNDRHGTLSGTARVPA
jgi:hypothetical protein